MSGKDGDRKDTTSPNECRTGIGCPACLGEETGAHARVNGFDVLKCRGCGLLWVKDISGEDLKNFYENEYFSCKSNIGYEGYLEDAENHKRNARAILKKAAGHIKLKNARILDIGCACGFLLGEARGIYGCDAYGLEPSSFASEIARQKGINVISANFGPELFQEDFFDIVFVIGTIEHLTDPAAVLAGAGRILRPGGLLIITTIDTGGLFPLYHLKPPEHLFYFNAGNLRMMLERSGFRMEKRSMLFVSYYLHDLLKRIGKYFKMNIFFGMANLVEKHIGSIPLRIPTNEMLVIARKTGETD